MVFYLFPERSEQEYGYDLFVCVALFRISFLCKL